MTLIITELSKLGIAMAADTALTVESLNPRRTIEDRAFNGLIKLLPVKKLQAGISYWGWSQIPPNKEIGNGVWMDWWLRDFLVKKHNKYSTIEELALLLESELRAPGGIPRLSDSEFETMPYGTGGIHLAGFTDYEDKKVPCFWHIHNGRSQALPDKKIDPKIVNANNDIPPEKFLELQKQSKTPLIRNGEIEKYARFFDNYLVKYLSKLRKEMGFILYPTLLHRAEFLKAQIRFISELYSVGGELSQNEKVLRKITRSIGNEVTILTITAEEGITNYITN